MRDTRRESLIEQYIADLIDGMDIKSMESFIADTISNNMEKLTDEEVLAEIKEYDPNLLD